DRGIVLAQKHRPDASAAPGHRETDLRREFARIVSLARDVDRLIEEGEWLSRSATSSPDPMPEQNEALEKIVRTGEGLVRRAAQVKHSLTLPNRDLLRCFYETIAIDDLLETLRGVNQSAAERLRRVRVAEQTRRMDEST